MLKAPKRINCYASEGQVTADGRCIVAWFTSRKLNFNLFFSFYVWLLPKGNVTNVSLKSDFLASPLSAGQGECTFKRAVIRRRRRGLPEGLSRLSCGVWDFKWEPACIVSIQSHCKLRAITLFLWVCQKLWRRKDLLLREYLTVSTFSLLPSFRLKDVLPWHNHKIWGKKWKILIKRQKKIPAHNRNW